MWEIITAILFIIGWFWIAYEMYVAPYKDEVGYEDQEELDNQP